MTGRLLYNSFNEEKLDELNSKIVVDFQPFSKKENGLFNLEHAWPEITTSCYKTRKNIILIGEVQSGKTNNILEIICKVVKESEYDHIIWLGGTNTELTLQSFKACRAFLDENNMADDYGDKFNISYYSDENLNLLDNFNRKNKINIHILQKNVDCIRKFYENINFGSKSNKKILLIDDECDYYSVDKKNKTKSRANEKKENSVPVYIDKLLEMNYNKALYLGITATPYWNFKDKGKLFPDKAILLNNNSQEYTGIKWFNERSDIIYVSTQDYKQGSNYRESIKLGLINFLYTILKRKNKQENSELVINIDLEKDVQEKIKGDIINIIRKWKNDIGNNIEKWKNEVNDFLVRLNYINFDYEISEELCNLVKNFDNICEVVLLNANSTYIKNNYKNNIIIGGVKVSRGFVFENLTTEVMINSPETTSQIDVLLQRARWFGYRRNKEDYIRVITNENIINAFREAEIVQNNLFSIFGKSWIAESEDIKKFEKKIKSYNKDKIFRNLRV